MLSVFHKGIQTNQIPAMNIPSVSGEFSHKRTLKMIRGSMSCNFSEDPSVKTSRKPLSVVSCNMAPSSRGHASFLFGPGAAFTVRLLANGRERAHTKPTPCPSLPLCRSTGLFSLGAASSLVIGRGNAGLVLLEDRVMEVCVPQMQSLPMTMAMHDPPAALLVFGRGCSVTTRHTSSGIGCFKCQAF